MTGWPKRSLIEARDEIRQKNIEIKRLMNTVDMLRAKLRGESSDGVHQKRNYVEQIHQEASVVAPHHSWKDFLFGCFRQY